MSTSTNTTLTTIIGARIRQIRQSKAMTQEKLAELAGLSSQFICQIETGKKSTSLKTLIKLSDALEVTIDDILYGISGPHDTDFRNANPNTTNTSTGHKSDLESFLSDCTPYERCVIFSSIKYLKESLHQNRFLLENHYLDE